MIQGYRDNELTYFYQLIINGIDSTIIRKTPDEKYAFSSEVIEHNGNITTKRHFGGSSRDLVDIPILYHNEYFKEIKIVQRLQDGGRVETFKYYDTSNNLFAGEGEKKSFAKGIRTFDSENRLVSEVTYDENDDIYRSMGYDYDKYGSVSAQYVLGVDGQPVRCGKLDENEMTYYMMKFVKNFYNRNISWKGVNEFGEECLIHYNDDNGNPWTFNRVIVENYLQDIEQDNTDNRYVSLLAIPSGKEIQERIMNPMSVCYIHILKKEGTVYQAGVRDGDLLLNIDRWQYVIGNNNIPETIWANGRSVQICVARPDPSRNRYNVLPFSITAGDRGAEIYNVYFTEKEVERLRESLDY